MAEGHGIIGDASVSDLPVTNIDNKELATERKMAHFAKTPEYKRLKEHFEERIGFYQSWLPDGRDPRQTSVEKAGQMWMVANAIVGELKAILATYENAVEAIKEAERDRTS